MNKSEKFWDKHVNEFDKDKENKSYTDIKTVENTNKYLNRSDIVLDYGCATGTKALQIAGNVKKIYGIDISSKMIEAAKRKTAERKIENADFVQATIFDKRYDAKSFDVILAFNILHFSEDMQKVMKRINELLKSGGLIISVTACLGEKKTFLSIFISFSIFLLLKIGMLPYMRFFKVSELEDFITHGDFQIVETESMIYNHITIYFIAAKKIERT
ncbi:MAG: methyltransferase domain-containing protein [Ignavibacteriales bacterium]|nr:methyltransferase domain-containing protein [Ignavibacteriales bacterium]